MSESGKNGDFNDVDYSHVFDEGAAPGSSSDSAPAGQSPETHYERARRHGGSIQQSFNDYEEGGVSLREETYQPSFKRDVAGIFFFTLLWCLFVAAFCGVILFLTNRGLYAQEHFKPTTGKVLSAEVESHSGSDSTTYSPEIEYSYTVDGVSYTNDDYELHNSSSSGGWAQRVVNEHPVGSEVTVYYNPDDPQDSALSVGVPAFARIAVIFMQPFIVVGIGMIVLTGRTIANYLHDKRLAGTDETIRIDDKIPMWCDSVKTTSYGFDLISRPRRSIVFPLIIGYGITMFASIFYFGFMRDFDQPWSESLTAMKIGLGVGIAAALVAIYKNFTSRASIFSFDLAGGYISMSAKNTNWELPVSNIKQWYIRRLNTDTRINNKPVMGYLLAIKSSDDREYPVHLFYRMSANSSRTKSVAAKTMKLLAEKTDAPFCEHVVVPPAMPNPLKDIFPESPTLKDISFKNLIKLAKQGNAMRKARAAARSPQPGSQYGSWKVSDYKDLK